MLGAISIVYLLYLASIQSTGISLMVYPNFYLGNEDTPHTLTETVDVAMLHKTCCSQCLLAPDSWIVINSILALDSGWLRAY